MKPQKPLLIYIAGPYTAADRQGIDENVNRAIDIGLEIFSRGHFPYIPHLTDLVDRRAKELGKEMSWSDFMAWDAPWLRVCDALIFTGTSRGASMELEEARRLGKTIFYSSSEVPRLEGPAHALPEG